MKMKPTQLLACLFTLVWCASVRGGSNEVARNGRMAKYEERVAAMSNKFVIAAGDLVSVHAPNFNLHTAYYRVRESIAGIAYSPGATVDVVYARDTLTTKLPERAVFLLVPAGTIWVSPGADASQGIFPDTPENRQKLQPYDKVLARLEAAKLPEKKARELALRYVAEKFPDYKVREADLTRKVACWVACIVWEAPGWHLSIFIVADTGKVTYLDETCD